MSNIKGRKVQLSLDIDVNAAITLKRLKKRLRIRRVVGFSVGFVFYIAAALILSYAFTTSGLTPVGRGLIGVIGAGMIGSCVVFLRIAAAPLIDVEDKLADRLEAFYLYLPNNTATSTDLTWRVVVNERLGELANLIWQLPNHLNTTNAAVTREANRIAGGLLAKQQRVSFEGSGVMLPELEVWSINAMKRFLEGNWQSIDDYDGDPVEPPKISKAARKRLIAVASAVMTLGLAVITIAAVVGGAAAGTVGVVAAAPILLIARQLFNRAGINVEGLKDTQDLAKSFLPASGDQPKDDGKGSDA